MDPKFYTKLYKGLKEAIYLSFHLSNPIEFIVLKGNILIVIIEHRLIDSYLLIQTIRAIYRYPQGFGFGGVSRVFWFPTSSWKLRSIKFQIFHHFCKSKLKFRWELRKKLNADKRNLIQSQNLP